VFSGITQGLFAVVDVKRAPALTHYTVDMRGLAQGLRTGASVSIDGVCQTVVGVQGTLVSFDAIGETLARTTLDALEVGRQVSVERALRAGDELGGHEVSGHVMAAARVASTRLFDGQCALWLEVPVELGKYLMPKGFVALDGSSLTVSEVLHEGSSTRFRVNLIPETLRLTGLGGRGVGERVNLELDARTVAVVETVERVLADRLSTSSR
jgi:riboflavin synthase